MSFDALSDLDVVRLRRFSIANIDSCGIPKGLRWDRFSEIAVQRPLCMITQ